LAGDWRAIGWFGLRFTQFSTHGYRKSVTGIESSESEKQSRKAAKFLSLIAFYFFRTIAVLVAVSRVSDPAIHRAAALRLQLLPLPPRQPLEVIGVQKESSAASDLTLETQKYEVSAARPFSIYFFQPIRPPLDHATLTDE